MVYQGETYNTHKTRMNEIAQVILFFLVSLVVLQLIDIEKYAYDSLNYVQLSQSFWKDGTFSLFNFNVGIRGVWYPLLLSPFIHVHKIWGWRVLAAALMTWFVCFLPGLWYPKINKRNMFIARMLLWGVLWLFWYGIFCYPLSDTVSIFLLTAGIYFVFKDKKAYLILGCILFYIAYNTRTIYLFPVIILIIYICVRSIFNRKLCSTLLCVFLGMIIAAIPQMVVNYNKYEVVSPKVITTDGYENGLFAFQLGEGLILSQYETYIGDADGYPNPGLRFSDPIGEAILSEEDIGNSGSMSIKDVIKVILRYPFDVMGIYGRHFINMLNPVWNEQYITDIHKIKIHLTLINYLFLCILSTWLINIKKWSIKNIRDWKNIFIKKESEEWVIDFAMLVPCIAILPGCVEQRFFFAFYLLLYIYLFFVLGRAGIRGVMAEWKRRPVLYLLVYGGIFVLLCSVWGNTYTNMGYDTWISIL